MAFKFCNELKILLPNTTSQFSVHICNLQLETPYWQYIKRVLNLFRSTDWSTYILCRAIPHLPYYPWEKCGKPKNCMSLQTRSRMAAVSCFRVRFSDWRSLASWNTDRLHHCNHERYPLEFLATDFQRRWQKYFTSRDWPKPETAHGKSVASKVWPKSAGQEIRHNFNSWVDRDAG